MSQDGYFREKLSAGVSCLVGLGSIKDRLANAFISMITVSPGGFSDPEMGNRYAEIYARVTAQDAVSDEGKIMATLGSISDEEAAEIAHDVFELHTAMQRAADKV
ncbi:hypothetical protein [Neorhizobium sp. T25_27]|uniref:hypothetical protein n=1 Tax=Neorhizobium sp. T25_27 TaxID=2093831 RepID=UPI000CF90E10|nr:hypothetical protein [Neorhizobium sp. T25_27]